ncbi:hypothetical protein HOY82DRAFT_456042, partial [Tuber indicum]
KIKLGDRLTTEQRQKVECLLFTWKDLFASSLEEMPTTDILEHRIPIYPHMRPTPAKEKIYTQEECDWLDKNIPAMEEAGIIAR